MNPGNNIESQARSIALLREEFQECLEKIITQTETTGESVRRMETIRSEATHLETLIRKHLTEERVRLLDIVQPLWVPDGTEQGDAGNPDEASKPTDLRNLQAGLIVVVDDEPVFRTPLVQQLKRDGYDCMEFSTGMDALGYLAGHPAQMVLLDVIMPDMSGHEVLEQIKNSEAMRDTPVIMTAQRHELDHIAGSIHEGAEDFLAKPYNPTIVRARVASSIQRKQLRELEQRTFLALVKSQQQLASELSEAAEYVTSLLPEKLSTPVATDWRYIPSSQLGGDSFGYHWIDDDHLAIYLLDVCGHGVGAALLSVSVLNFLRSGTMHEEEARKPSSVLAHLNTTFLMGRHNDMYFSLWYGVYNTRRQELEFSSGGHPPAILLIPGSDPRSLSAGGTVIGAIQSPDYQAECVNIPTGSRLYVFSDGAYELNRPGAPMMRYTDFVHLLKNNTSESGLGGILRCIEEQHGGAIFDDDISLMEFRFLGPSPISREALSLHNTMEEWSKLLRFTEEFAFHHGIAREDLVNIDVIIEEVATNILKYGGVPSDAEACLIELILNGTQLTIKISDSGTPFNPLLLPEVDTMKGIKDRPIGGLGIHFVKKLSLSQHYEYRNGKNILTLITELRS